MSKQNPLPRGTKAAPVKPAFKPATNDSRQQHFVNSGIQKHIPDSTPVLPKPRVSVSDPHWQAKTEGLGKFVGSAHAAFRSSLSAPRSVHGLPKVKGK
jgi:hypothetical protein